MGAQEDLLRDRASLEALQREFREIKTRFQETEDRYRAILDRSLFCIYLHDLQGRFLDANEAGLRLLGCTREDLLSLDLAAVLNAEGLATARARMQELVREGTSRGSWEYRVRRRDGQWVWLEVDTCPIYREGRPWAVQGVATDITLRKKAEQALKESEAKYHSLFSESADAIYFTTTDGVLEDANPALLSLFGYSREELIARLNVRELYFDPRDRLVFQSEIEAKGFLRNFPVTLRRKDGAPMDCLLTSSIRRSEEGELLGYQGIIRDVTEQKRGERALRDREAHYRAMVEAFDGFIYICSKDYRVEFMNRRFIARTGYDGTGGLCYKVIHDLDEVCPWCVNERVMKGESVHWEVLSPKDDRWYYVVNTPIVHADGTVSKQAMIMDITDRKRMEQDLLESAEKLKRFAYSVSHDLKNPAIGAYGLAKRLAERYHDVMDEKGRQYCTQILGASKQIADLVGQINLFIEAKEAPFRVEDVEVKEVLKGVREMFSPQLKARGITWREPEWIPPILADRLCLARILQNLVDNALKYGGEGLSLLRIAYRDGGDHHVLCLSDDGAGIAGGDRERIFDMFLRRENARGIQGTGLGLAIVKEMADRHGGMAWVEPGEGQGSTFCISLSKDLPLDETPPAS